MPAGRSTRYTTRLTATAAAGPDCRNPGKHPRTREGFYDATTDRRAVDRWWRRWPDANIGVPIGSRSGLAVVDLDGPAGAAIWREPTSDRNEPQTAQVTTPYGRPHWYRLPSGLSLPRSIRGLGNGIDVVGDNGYVIVPPSRIDCRGRPHDRNDCSGVYSWINQPRGSLPSRPGYLSDCPTEALSCVESGACVASFTLRPTSTERSSMRSATLAATHSLYCEAKPPASPPLDPATATTPSTVPRGDYASLYRVVRSLNRKFATNSYEPPADAVSSVTTAFEPPARQCSQDLAAACKATLNRVLRSSWPHAQRAASHRRGRGTMVRLQSVVSWRRGDA